MNAIAELAAAGLVRGDVHIGSLTTYRLGGPARWFAEPDTIDELRAVVTAANEAELPILMLGRGSNIAVSDSGYDGVVLRLGAGFRSLSVADGVADAGGALSLPQLARATVDEGWGGLEFYVGIPGSVGGAVTMNAGFYGTETADVLIDATVVDVLSADVRTWSVADLSYAYRSSAIGPTDAVVGARFSVTPADRAASQDRMREVTRWRKEHQPGGTHNAGSVFKNPPGDFAGRLIDVLGLKGLAVGDVSVSEKHANFFVAGPNATAADVHALVHRVMAAVEEGHGVVLEPEIRFYGEFTAVER